MPVTKPRDPVDAWLDEDVELMHPPQGRFQRISRRARRRKAIQATLTVAGAAVIITGLAVAPNLTSFLPNSRTGASVEGARHRPSPRGSLQHSSAAGTHRPVA